MPTEEQPHTPALDGMPEPEQIPGTESGHDPEHEAGESAELRYKTLAFKLEEGAHAKLHFIAQLRGSNAAREARLAIETHLANAQQDPELVKRADQARQAIEREAAARAAAIAGFMGGAAVEAEATPDEPTPSRSRRQRGSKAEG